MRFFNYAPMMTATLYVAVLLVACSGDPASSNNDVAAVKVSVNTTTTSAPAANKLNSVVSDSITITSARVVIEKIRFDSSVDDTLDFRFRQPFVQDLALNSGVNVIETIEVPFGSYKKTEIKIDDLDPEDGDVFLQNPELQDKSIVIKGFMSGDASQTFTFSTEFDEEQEREFSPPLVLDENSPVTNVVLFIDMDSWFVDKNGNLLDPRSSGNESAIRENIKNSIDIFEDKDDDGERDS